MQALQEENTALKIENANLKVENDLYKAGGIPEPIQKSNQWPLEMTDPQFVEWTYAGCMKEAFDIYVAQGTEHCKKAWYTAVDIAANKCQLENAVIEQLKYTKTKAEWECNNLYK